MKSTWAHLHLPRLQSGVTDVISVKVPGQRILYASSVKLANARFVVSESGRQRCLREGVRNVHAWIVGEELSRLTGTPPREPIGDWCQAVYDPWLGDSFVDLHTLAPVHRASRVVMSGKNVYYRPMKEGE